MGIVDGRLLTRPRRRPVVERQAAVVVLVDAAVGNAEMHVGVVG